MSIWKYLRDEKPPPDTEVCVFVRVLKPVTLSSYIPRIVDHTGKKFPAKWISKTYGNKNAQPEHQWKFNSTSKPDFNEPCKLPQRKGRHEEYFDDRTGKGNHHYCRACGAVCTGCIFCRKQK